MFAIFEGGDGVGKSTLAESVAERLQELYPDDTVELLHRGPPERSVFDEYAFDVDDYRPGTGRHIVADRWHLGTLVYAQLYRGLGPYGELEESGFRWVDLFLRTRGACVWLVDHPNASVRQRLRIRGEDYLLPKDLDYCLNRFREVIQLSSMSRGKVDTSQSNPQALMDNLIRTLTFAERDSSRFNAFPGYVGGATPKVLLVGEKHGGKPPHKSEAAFIPTGSNSSSYLMGALPDDLWKHVGLVNVYETDVRALLMTFDVKPAVVALGRAASVNLKQIDIDHGSVPHPQWVRRFHFLDSREYGGLIEHVARTGENRISAWK